MGVLESTSWTLIRGAAAGSNEDREAFVRRYSPVIRAYLKARWAASRHRDKLEDALHAVFLDCFRESGVLGRADPDRPGGFRAFLYGVTRTVALRIESGGQRRRPDSDGELDRLPGDSQTLSAAFDRAWAEMVLREALDHLLTSAESKGTRAVRRVDLLRRRVYEDLPIREISRQLVCDPEVLHREYAVVRREFRNALRAALGRHAAGPEPVTDQDMMDLLKLLG